MATTSIWSVKGWLGQVLIYTENPDKTKNPNCFESINASDSELQGLSDVIKYAMNEQKTTLENLDDENFSLMSHFVSGINCGVDTARDEMIAVKKRFGKDDGIVAFHGYQSFAPGESLPEIAHEIGIKLAEKLWGDRFQVIVTTHLDHANHIHNHFVVNSVSFFDGKRFYRSKKDYFTMRSESDNLCIEYGLSVIDKPAVAKSQHYSEWQANKENCQTIRSIIKEDVDKAISEARTEKQFYYILRTKYGYSAKMGKDITLIPLGKERGIKLERNFGSAYSREALCSRILANIVKPKISYKLSSKKYQCANYKKAPKMSGLRVLYFRYMYKIGAIAPKQMSAKQSYFLYREDIIKLRSFSQQARLLVNNKIDTAVQLLTYKETLGLKREKIRTKRNPLYAKLKTAQNEVSKNTIEKEIKELSKELYKTVSEIKCCNAIMERSKTIKDKFSIEAQTKSNKARLTEKEINYGIL